MAQKTEKEETEFKLVTETITPSSPSPSSLLISKPKPRTATATSSSTSPATSSSSPAVNLYPILEKSEKEKTEFKLTTSPATSSSSPAVNLCPVREKRELVVDEAEEEGRFPVKRAVLRCSGCRRKVGLTGFRCRCGELFCGDHRYSDRHECGFDYKLAGRDAIARENPVVKAAKVVKI